MLAAMGLLCIELLIKMPLKIHNRFMRDIRKAQAEGRLR